MQKAHDASYNSYWKNLPDITTPIVAEQLNRNELTVDTLDDRIVTFDTTKADETDMLVAFKSVSFDSSTGVFTFTKFNNTTVDVNTDLEKIAVNFDYDDDPTSAHYQQLIITLLDGTVKYIDMSALITQYEFNNSSTIAFTVGSGGAISAAVIDGSITEAKLQPNFLADCRSERTKAETASSNSEAWAVGQRSGSDVPSTDETYHNNSKYYAGLADDRATDAEQAKQDAEDAVDEIYTALNMVQFTVDFTTGELMYTDDTAYIFTVNETTGNLEWEVQSV